MSQFLDALVRSGAATRYPYSKNLPSQWVVDSGGKDVSLACTHFALAAARYLLRNQATNFFDPATFTASKHRELSDAIFKFGSDTYCKETGGRSEMTDFPVTYPDDPSHDLVLLSLQTDDVPWPPQFRPNNDDAYDVSDVANVIKDSLLAGTITNSIPVIGATIAQANHMHGLQRDVGGVLYGEPHAILFTIGSASLCIVKPRHRRNASEPEFWYIFDSHGASSGSRVPNSLFVRVTSPYDVARYIAARYGAGAKLVSYRVFLRQIQHQQAVEYVYKMIQERNTLFKNRYKNTASSRARVRSHAHLSESDDEDDIW